MYSTKNLIILSAKRNKLNQLFTETMSDMPQKAIAIQDTSQTTLSSILEQLDEKDILVTNDNYENERCDFQVITKQGKIILSVNEDGNIINELEQSEYIDESNCELLTRVYDYIRHGSDSICIVTTAA